MNTTGDKEFDERNRDFVERMGRNEELRRLSLEWLRKANELEYSYHFTWLGRPIIQFPSDVMAVQELIWSVKPDLIVETGVARGGSLILSASILELLGGDGLVLGIDIDIREHNRVEIERHPMAHRIQMLEGSAIDPKIVSQVESLAEKRKRVLIFLDSNHTHEHVLKELRAYSPMVGKDSYLVVFDTVIEDFPSGSFEGRPWDLGDNPKTAVWEFLKENDRFEIDEAMQHKLLVTVAPDGFLRCVRD